MKIRDWMRSDLRDIQPYQVIPGTGVRMDANESPFSLDAAVRRELARRIMDDCRLQYYPDTDSAALRKKIAAYYGVGMDQVCCGVGSDQMIDLLSKAFLEEGERILAPAPSFSMYGLTAQINHGEAASFPLNDDFEYDFSYIMEAYQKKIPKILYICSPNNPTGRLIDDALLRRILDATECIVVLDEAYGEFAGADHVALLEEYPQLVILKTFSKAYGLAGLRVGYSLSSVEIREILDTVRPPYNLSTFSQMAAEIALGREEYEVQARYLTAEREWVYNELKAMEEKCGIRVYPSDANFLFIDCDKDGVGDALREQEILVRAYGGTMSQFIRMSVGIHEENERFVLKFKELVGRK